MEPTPRLFLCIRCHEQVVLCSWCDHGQIYCGRTCAELARQKSLRLARLRYQHTFNGRRNHAACQARYRARLKNKVMDHGSPQTNRCDVINLPEKKTENTVIVQISQPMTCCFCKTPVSDWIRNDFLRRRDRKSVTSLRSSAQAP